MGEIRYSEEMKKLVLRLKKEGKKIVFTNGCFDLLHYGHIEFLKKAKEHGDILIVGVNSDNSVKRIKGSKRPIITLKERLSILSELKMIDYIVVFEEDDPSNLISNLKPDVHVKGGDWKIEDLPEARIVHSYGGKVVILKETIGPTTTEIIKRITDRYCE